ncbi:MAG: Sec-independent protein translocase protein TatB [Desulfobulbales bacterium]
MFGIGLPEMIVILAVALIVVGPEKLPDLARSVAKGILELKKTLNQVKDSLADEDNLIDSVQSDLRKTADDLKGNLIESDHFTWRKPEGAPREDGLQGGDILDVEEQPSEPETELDENQVPAPGTSPERHTSKKTGAKKPDEDLTAAGDLDAPKK